MPISVNKLNSSGYLSTDSSISDGNVTASDGHHAKDLGRKT